MAEESSGSAYFGIMKRLILPMCGFVIASVLLLLLSLFFSLRVYTMSAKQSEKKAEENGSSAGAKQEGEVKKKLPQLGALEDDDEFEVSVSSAY